MGQFMLNQTYSRIAKSNIYTVQSTKNQEHSYTNGLNDYDSMLFLSCFCYAFKTVCLQSCQPRVTVMACFVYNIIRDL